MSDHIHDQANEIVNSESFAQDIQTHINHQQWVIEWAVHFVEKHDDISPETKAQLINDVRLADMEIAEWTLYCE